MSLRASGMPKPSSICEYLFSTLVYAHKLYRYLTFDDPKHIHLDECKAFSMFVADGTDIF